MKTVLMTGLTGGLGQASFSKLMQQNYHVIALVRGGVERLKTSEFKLMQKALEDERLVVIDWDFSDQEALEQLIDRHIPAQGLDALLLIAGFSVFGPSLNAKWEDFESLVFVNTYVPMLLVQSFYPHLKKRKGKIISTSSISGSVVFRYYGPYSASKYAMEAIFESFYHELEDVSVSLIRPAGMKTKIKDRWTFLQGPDMNKSYQYFQNFIKKDAIKHLNPPDLFGKKVISILKSQNPRFIYHVGKGSFLITALRKYFPWSLWSLLAKLIQSNMQKTTD